MVSESITAGDDSCEEYGASKPARLRTTQGAVARQASAPEGALAKLENNRRYFAPCGARVGARQPDESQVSDSSPSRFLRGRSFHLTVSFQRAGTFSAGGVWVGMKLETDHPMDFPTP